MKVLITGGTGDIAMAIANSFKLWLEDTEILNPSKKELDVTNEKMVVEYLHVHAPDVVINVAGYISVQSITESTLEELSRHFSINVAGAYLVTREALKNGCKQVINIASTSAYEGKANWGFYCASKAALVSLSETLTREGYNCVVISPGRTDTKMRKALAPNEDTTSLMSPRKVADIVVGVIDGKYKSGSQIIVTKDNLFVLPMRSCPKL